MRLFSIEIDGREVYLFQCEFPQRKVPSQAGFTFDHKDLLSGYFNGRRYWYTYDPQIAATLVRYAVPDLRARLQSRAPVSRERPTLRWQAELGLYVFTFEKPDRALAREAGFTNDHELDAWVTTEADRASKLLQFADEETSRHIEVGLREQEAARLASRSIDAEIEIPVPDGLEYRGYQRAAVAVAARQFAKPHSPGLLIGDEPGVGKTIEAIGILNYLGDYGKVLLVCPASLKVNWYRELNRWLVATKKILIAEGQTAKWKFAAADICIVNYDVLGKHLDWYKKRARSRSTIEIEDLGNLDQDWDVLICDEAHVIKNPSTQRASFTLALCERIARRVFLTGTPIDNKPGELFTLIRALDPVTWSDAFKYQSRYAKGNANHLVELQDRLRRSGLMIRRVKSQVLTELPPKVRQVIEFDANDSPAARTAVAREQRAWSAREAELEQLRVAVELAKASDDSVAYQQAVRALRDGVRVSFQEMARLRIETARAKLPFVITHIQDLIDNDPNYKVIVFAHHIEIIDAIAKAFGPRAVVINGSVPSRIKIVDGRETSERQIRVDRFQTDATVQVIVGEYKSMGVGLTLTASSHVIAAELTWVPSEMVQAEDRAHRLGQRDSVLVQHLVLQNSIDANMARALVEKQELSYIALDKEGSEVKTTEESEDAVLPVDVEESATKGLRREALDRLAADLVPAQITEIHQKLKALACADGLNRIDAHIARSLAESHSLSAKQAALGQKLLTRYREVLPA